MKGSLRIAKIFNIPVEVHWSFLFLFVYVIYLAIQENWGIWGAVSASLFVLILFLCVASQYCMSVISLLFVGCLLLLIWLSFVDFLYGLLVRCSLFIVGHCYLRGVVFV